MIDDAADGSEWCAFTFNKHSGGNGGGGVWGWGAGGSTCWIAGGFFGLSGNGTVILPLSDKNRPSLFLFPSRHLPPY